MKELSEQTLKYLYTIRSLNSTLYNKMIARQEISDEMVLLNRIDIPEEKSEVYHSPVSKAVMKENRKPDDKWDSIIFLAGRPYMDDGNSHKKEKPSNTQKEVLLYIDAENVGAQHADKIMSLVKNRGEIVEARWYNRQNDNSTVHWKEAAKKYKLKNISMYGEPEKDKIDKKIKEHIRKALAHGAGDIICLVTSDGGYEDIVKEVAESDTEIIVIGEKKTPPRLRKALKGNLKVL
ncbi:MAG: NYN domain-containing protein [Lachnospiraceae bacterium]|nr:NYN domain-containing protein [Lachnospiraceae bacterium]